MVLDASGDISGGRNLTLSGELAAATLDISGNIDIDGTANLDAVDIDGAVQIDGATTFGVDDTGVDVKMFGATSGAYMLWDESADQLKLAGDAGLSVSSDGEIGISGLSVHSATSGVNVGKFVYLADSGGVYPASPIPEYKEVTTSSYLYSRMSSASSTTYGSSTTSISFDTLISDQESDIVQAGLDRVRVGAKFTIKTAVFEITSISGASMGVKYLSGADSVNPSSSGDASPLKIENRIHTGELGIGFYDADSKLVDHGYVTANIKAGDVIRFNDELYLSDQAVSNGSTNLYGLVTNTPPTTDGYLVKKLGYAVQARATHGHSETTIRMKVQIQPGVEL